MHATRTMDKEQAERTASKILAEVEETMGWEGVIVQTRDPGDRVNVRAFFENLEYRAIEKAIVRILIEAAKAPVTVQPAGRRCGINRALKC